jgi:hypothetical protein
MCWFRSRAKWGSYLALFALVVQFALSFGHLHRYAPVPITTSSIAFANTHAIAGQANPARNGHLAHGYCAVCALIHFTGSMVRAESPSVRQPIAFSRVWLEGAIDLALAPQQDIRFQARAPPIA